MLKYPWPITDPTVEQRAAAMLINRSPLGHYYSPVPDTRELVVEPRRSQIWPSRPDDNPAIDWRADAQLELLARLGAQEHFSYPVQPTGDPTEYHSRNDMFPLYDGWPLEAMVRDAKPGRIIEVGSGFSSLITARVNRELFDSQIEFTCIEPYPRDFLLQGVPGISGLRIELIQDTPLEVFDALEPNDILFIDTSHTVKTGGDVPWIYNRILPRVPDGVLVQIHDMFLPGDYPQQWVFEGWGWNEIYLAESFLSFNSGYRIELGVQYLLQRHFSEFVDAFPGIDGPDHAHTAGASLWLRRTA